jgi:Tfp pilus assembly protein PilO
LEFAKDFEELDSISYGYRYPIDLKENYSTKPNQNINLTAFYSSMDELMEQFDTVSFGFDVTESISQEIYEIMCDDYDPLDY